MADERSVTGERAGTEGVVRVAMWSGPRNISTALMRAWENRADTAVWDEPFYAHYLVATGVDHPGREEVVATHETDPERIVARILGPAPGGARVFYQKHMAHHMVGRLDLGWMDHVENAFLIRDPEEVVASLSRTVPEPNLDQTGLPQELALFERVRERTGGVPPVIDARDVLDDPRRALRALCKALGIPFTRRMLSWPAGGRATDGVWAKHWYGRVERSTGFLPARARTTEVAPGLGRLLQDCRPLYEALRRHRLRG